MRKTLSLILSVMMILSVCVFAIPASAAPEGTAINTADEFMAMAAEGKYYLNSDITLAATYANAFVGTLDGNGHTLTITNPVFNDFSGEVKNLTLNGDIVYTDAADVAAFTLFSAKGFNATDCTSNVNITSTGACQLAGAFVSDCREIESPCIFTNCVNNGDFYLTNIDGVTKGRVGGFAGYLDSVILYNCTNNGDMYANTYDAMVGGFVGWAANEAGSNRVEAYNCVNNGNIKGDPVYVKAEDNSYVNGDTIGGGFFGRIGVKSNVGWYKIYGGINNGNIDVTYEAGGFVGYCYASGSNAFLDIQFCINAGDIIYGRTNNNGGAVTDLVDFGSPFVSYTNSPVTTIKYCIDIGTVTRRDGHIAMNSFGIFVGCSSADATQYDVQSVYVLNKEQYTYFTWAQADTNEKNRLDIGFAEGIKVTTLEDIKSGKVAYEINTAAADDPYMSNAIMQDDVTFNPGAAYSFYQKLGTEDLPTGREVEIADAWVVLDGTTYKNGDKAADAVTEPPVTTEKPEDTTAPEDDATEAPGDDATEAAPGGDATEAPADTTEPAKSGCGSVISGVVAIVAILGSALIIKKRD